MTRDNFKKENLTAWKCLKTRSQLKLIFKLAKKNYEILFRNLILSIFILFDLLRFKNKILGLFIDKFIISRNASLHGVLMSKSTLDFRIAVQDDLINFQHFSVQEPLIKGRTIINSWENSRQDVY